MGITFIYDNFPEMWEFNYYFNVYGFFPQMSTVHLEIILKTK